MSPPAPRNIFQVKFLTSFIDNVLLVVIDMTSQKEMEDKFAKSESVFKGLFDNMSSGVAIYEAKYKGRSFFIKDFNKAAEKIENIKKDKIIGKNVEEIFPGIKKFGLLDVLREVWKTGKPTHFPLKLYKDKRVMGWKENYVYKLPSGEIVAIYDDVTKEKIAEQKLEESEEKFSSVFQLAPYSLAVSRVKDGIFLDVNKAFVRLSGVSKKEALLDKTVRTYDLWANAHDRNEALVELKNKGIMLNKEYDFKVKDGRILTGLYSARILEIGGEQCVLSSVADISEVKEAERKLHELKDRDEAILNSISNGVLACDKNGVILFCNKTAGEMTGYLPKIAIGKNFSKVVHFVDKRGKEIDKDLVSNAIKTNKIIKSQGHILLASKDDRQFPVSSSAAPVKNLSGEVIGCVVVINDITEERRVDKAKTEFVSLASHQLRTPLSIINWYSELLMSKDFGNLTKKQYECAKETYVASKRMVSLINALLNVSRLEAGGFLVEPKKISISRLANTVLNEFAPQIDKKKLKVNTRVDNGVKWLMVDPKLLYIILQNFLSNSVKYTKYGGIINLAVEKKGKTFQISVKDNGIGIPKRQQREIFTKLFRADNVKIIDSDGTGLGLYTVKAIVDKTGGKVWFESKEGKGSTFYVSYPLIGMAAKKGDKKLV